MSGAEIYLKFKAWMEDKASAGLQALSSTAQKAAGAVGRVAGAMGSLLGDACGPVATKASAAIGGFIDSVTRLGPLGGVIAGAQILVQGAVAHFKEEVEAFKKGVDEMAAKVRARFDEIDKARMDRLNASLKEASTLAAARDNAARTEGDLMAAGERLKQARLGQAAAVARGMKGVNEAKAARDDLVAARRQQERAEAEKVLVQIEKNTANLDAKFDELLQIKDGGRA